MDMPSQCMIVRIIGRSAYSSKPNTQNKQLHSVSFVMNYILSVKRNLYS
jgi:hypothetical protein